MFSNNGTALQRRNGFRRCNLLGCALIEFVRFTISASDDGPELSCMKEGLHDLSWQDCGRE